MCLEAGDIFDPHPAREHRALVAVHADDERHVVLAARLVHGDRVVGDRPAKLSATTSDVIIASVRFLFFMSALLVSNRCFHTKANIRCAGRADKEATAGGPSVASALLSPPSPLYRAG